MLVLNSKKEYMILIKVLIVACFIGSFMDIRAMQDEICKLKEINSTHIKNEYELLDIISRYDETIDAIDELQSMYDNEISSIKRNINNLDYIDKNEISVLNRIVEAEATGGTIQQKINVAKCIINRMYSDKFPNTIHGVVFQYNQFQPTFDGRYYSVSIKDDTVKAVKIAMNYYKEDNENGLYFMARNSSSVKNVNWFDNKLDFLFNDGIHDHFKEK